MNVSILCIGNELLSGKTLNTNASWISRKLSDIGCDIVEHLVVPDKKEAIFTGLEHLTINNLDCLIITGGLGPTDDDITRPTIFEYVGTDSKFDEDYWTLLSEKFQKLGMNIPATNRNQALIPINGEVIENPTGSARGLKFLLNGGEMLFVLPGVPSEMKDMMNASVIPCIKENVKTSINTRTLRTTGIPESALIEEIVEPISSNHGCNIGYYPSLYGVDIRISSGFQDKVNELSNKLYNILGHKIYCEGEYDIENVVVKNAIDKDKTIALAESCTGGLIGDRVTNTDGSSKVFKGSMVVYSNKAKIDLLGVNKNTLDSFGSVSEEVAREMANNVRKTFLTDYGLSVTGVAGPGGGTENKPVGLVYIGLSDENKTEVQRFNFSSDRKKNKLKTSQVALDWLRIKLINE